MRCAIRLSTCTQYLGNAGSESWPQIETVCNSTMCGQVLVASYASQLALIMNDDAGGCRCYRMTRAEENETSLNGQPRMSIACTPRCMRRPCLSVLTESLPMAPIRGGLPDGSLFIVSPPYCTSCT